jgi:hypothetical protein
LQLHHPYLVARRADPTSTYQAGHAAIRNRMLSSACSEKTAERWLQSWEIEAATRGIPSTGGFWTVGDAWIALRQRARPAMPHAGA